ncbi:MAG: S9 family peptidase [Burkholderiaceae bacterium]|nr:S9 family peptidase [Burkholderiaceae bacterium]
MKPSPLQRPRCLLVAALIACQIAGAEALAQQPEQQLAYPHTRQVDQVDNYFGTKVADPYRWLEDDHAADTEAWVAAQNKLTFGYLAAIPYRAQVQQRVKALANYVRYSAPFKKNGDLFYYKNDGLQNQSVLYTQKGGDGKPEVLLDPNSFSADGTVRLTSFVLSKDGRYAAYGRTAIPGSDWYDLYVMDMQTRQTLPEVLHWARYAHAAWRGDGFYYSRYPEPEKGKELTAKNEYQKVYFHKVGTPQSADTLIYEDNEHPSYYVGVETTEDERFAVLSAQDPNKRGNSLLVRDDAKGDAAFTPIIKENSEDSFGVVDNMADKLLIQTNRNAPNQKVMLYDPAHPAEADWTTVLPEKPEPMENVAATGGKLFVTYLKDVSARTMVYDRDGKFENEIALPGPGTVGGFYGEKGDKDTYYVFTTMNYPPTIFRYDIAGRTSELYRAPEIPGFKSDQYESKQVFYRSKDGTRIPMFLVYKKGLKQDGKNPAILYGYGGFDITINPGFSAPRIAWLEQGGIFAIANLRGGGEYGEKWHEAGMKLNKQNVFDDCIAAAEYLIREKYTSPQRLALQGGSNGGLLVGAVVNQRPDLFRVALPEVGVMDMLRFQKFTAGVGWVSDYGSSDDETQFHYLLGYSPLHNIKAGAKYPAILALTSDHDDRVVPAHSFKYMATMQARNPHGAPALIRIETHSGHGASNLSKNLEQTADIYAFTWKNMGITPRYPH